MVSVSRAKKIVRNHDFSDNYSGRWICQKHAAKISHHFWAGWRTKIENTENGAEIQCFRPGRSQLGTSLVYFSQLEAGEGSPDGSRVTKLINIDHSDCVDSPRYPVYSLTPRNS